MVKGSWAARLVSMALYHLLMLAEERQKKKKVAADTACIMVLCGSPKKHAF